MSKATEIVVSAVVTAYDAQDYLADVVNALIAALSSSYALYEIILVDDSSQDRTPEVIDQLLKRHQYLRSLRLSRRFGIEAAIAAGLESSIGDFAVVLDSSCDPPELAPLLIEKCRETGGVVVGISLDRAERRGVQRIAASALHWYCRRFVGISLYPNATHFCGLSRQAVNAVTQIKDRQRFLRLLMFAVGFGQATVDYREVRRDARHSGPRLWSEMERAIDMVVGMSRHPLRWITRFAVIAALLHCALSLANIIRPALFPAAANWPMAFLMLLLFLVLAVLGEYAGRTLEETCARPLYFVLAEKHSNLLLENDIRKNIVTHTHDASPSAIA